MMSEKDFSCAISPKEKTLGVCRLVNNNNNTAEDSADKCVSNNSSSPDRDLRERVLKEVGLTSSTFIGPAFPPKATTVKDDIEDTLSEFYKELEKIDAPDGANVNSEPSMQPRASASKELQYAHNNNNTSRPAGTDAYQRSSGQKQTSWPHRYQNEPYYPRRPRSPSYTPAYHQQHYPQAPNRPPNPRFHRPPSHRPPPPSAFPNPLNRTPQMNHSWSGSDVMRQYREECHFPPFSRFPPTYECSHPSQGFYEDTPHHLGRDEQGYNHDAQPDRVNAGWSRDTQEEWSQSGEGHDQRQRSDSANELWQQQQQQQQQHHCRPPDNTRAHYSSSVLILMRGLPGSGKSTKSRELLSTGPSGLILSTDDYFAHKDGYHYEPTLLGVAHEWNQSRAKDAMHDGRSPIIIDNTNIQAWEMKPYVKMALETGYRVDFCEPDTCWKFDSYELEKRNKHGVPQEKIAQMLDRFSFPISIDVVMSSQEPPHVNQRCRPEQAQMMRENRGFY